MGLGGNAGSRAPATVARDDQVNQKLGTPRRGEAEAGLPHEKLPKLLLAQTPEGSQVTGRC